MVICVCGFGCGKQLVVGDEVPRAGMRTAGFPPRPKLLRDDTEENGGRLAATAAVGRTVFSDVRYVSSNMRPLSHKRGGDVSVTLHGLHDSKGSSRETADFFPRDAS